MGSVAATALILEICVWFVNGDHCYQLSQFKLNITVAPCFFFVKIETKNQLLAEL